MLASTHQKIIDSINTQIALLDPKHKIRLRGSTLADEIRKESHPKYKDIKLHKHHNKKINRDRIKKLIFHAKESYQKEDHPYNIWDATRDGALAIHFICDSAIPPLSRQCSEEKQKFLTNLFDKVEIEDNWNNISENEIDDLDINELIDEFLDEMPVNSQDKNDIQEAMKKVYQTSLKVAKFIFSKSERKILEDEEIYKLLKNVHFVFPFENHMRIMDETSRLVRGNGFLFSIKLNFDENSVEGIEKLIEGIAVYVENNKFTFRRLNSRLYDNEFYIFFKFNFLSSLHGTKKNSYDYKNKRRLSKH